MTAEEEEGEGLERKRGPRREHGGVGAHEPESALINAAYLTSCLPNDGEKTRHIPARLGASVMTGSHLAWRAPHTRLGNQLGRGGVGVWGGGMNMEAMREPWGSRLQSLSGWTRRPSVCLFR